MLPLAILFAHFTIAICAVGAIIMCVLIFSDWDKKSDHEDHAHDPHSHHH